MAGIGFGVGAMAMGIMDPTKQMLLVNVLTDASLLAAAAWATGRLAERFQGLRRSITPWLAARRNACLASIRLCSAGANFRLFRSVKFSSNLTGTSR